MPGEIYGQPFDRDALVHSAVRSWRDGLINLTGANRLLNFRPSRSGAVELVRPSPAEVLARLRAGGAYGLRSLTPAPAEDGAGEPQPVAAPAADLLDTRKDPDALGLALRGLYRRSNQEFLDRGVRVLHLAVGTLAWSDADRSRYASPLLLVPVQLVIRVSGQMPVLQATDDDPVVNPALALKLAQHGIELPQVDDPDQVALIGLLDAIRSAVSCRGDWEVSESFVLSYFSFAKEAMYRDLLEHEDLVVSHPAVVALVAGGRGAERPAFYFDEIPADEVDRRASPESTPVILDADSSQRTAIAAALQGRSFVMDGPPGTGKSQTIANMIGVLLHAGKSVLFVSEKAAALDVVRDRLDAAGLGAYLLELHSRNATRKEVAVALGAALDNVPVPPPLMPAMEVDAARKRREELNAYADAMNSPRGPLGYSLHDVLGMVARLHEIPAAPATGHAPAGLTVEEFGEIRGAAARLAAAWRPAVQGHSFVWRGVTETGSLDSRLYQAAAALKILSGMAGVNPALADAAGLLRPSDTSALARLLDHLAARPPGLPEQWLAAGTLNAAADTVSEAAAMLAEISARENDVYRFAGIPWSAAPQAGMLPPGGGASLASLTPPAIELDDHRTEQLTALTRALTSDADMLERRMGSMSGLASMLGLQAPATFRDAEGLLAIVAIAREPHRPERGWLSAAGLDAAYTAARTLHDARQALAAAEDAASPYYTSAVLAEDAEAIAQRFESEHHRLGRLSGDYRADKKTVASFTRDGTSKDTAYQQLGLAVAWVNAARALTAAEMTHAQVLGRYYAGPATDYEMLASALNLADTAVSGARGQNLSRAADSIAQDTVSNPVINGAADETQQDLRAWQATLAPSPATAARPELLAGTIADAIGWLRAHISPLEAAAAYTRMATEAAGQPVNYAQARHLVGLRGAADSAHLRLSQHSAMFTDTLGDLYADARTDIDVVRSALEWARHLRLMVTGADLALTPAQLKAASGAIPIPGLAAAAETWRQARDALISAFRPGRQQDLAAELDDYADAPDLIAALQEDTGGKDEWHAYQACRTALTVHGLDVAIDFCISERIPARQVPQVIERAILQEWADHQLRTDPALATTRAADRDALVSEYQALDKALIGGAISRIIRACNARRPRSDVGESAIIRHEAEKKRKHMPVRALIGSSRHVTQAIKPCFMMSPLSVSQYLPADIHFDVIIFDEASQVSPGDAINCIYRGSALILSGDQKQLPPSSFFASAGVGDDEEWSEDSDDTADFESVLDLAKASGAYRSLTLRWHYRSRHEALIAFSNSSFYKGQLVTFPSRHSVGPDVGVELFWVDGSYRRGTTRDNPDEAAEVARRVIRHYDTRPSLSLGVVTFSEAQAVAIETAITRVRQDRPDLDRLFTNDRLSGFFVKNLESVQGDERDVLIFSIGYGPDENRKITMNFGPLNKQGGWRRLNVAITRARYRNEIVSSIRAGDIPESAAAEGVRQLRRYLDYAARGMSALALDTSSGGDAESPFEESVISAVRSWGYDPTPQVGTAGYRIDIGVRHPDHPGVYAIGVECDGYQYHSSRVARDRDRLRENVLRGLGWHLHRIWGTAWYRDRNGEERKLRAAIEQAITAPVHGLLARPGLPGESGRTIVPTEAAVFDRVPDWTSPYFTADVPRLPNWKDPGDLGSVPDMAAGIRAAVMTETPIHIAVLRQRLREAWDIGRISPRIRDNIDSAIRVAGVMRDGDFITLTGPLLATVRTPTEACRRDVEHVHDRELALAMINLVRDAGGASHDELTARVARIYGWTRRGPDITNRMQRIISELVSSGTLTGDADSLTAAG